MKKWHVIAIFSGLLIIWTLAWVLPVLLIPCWERRGQFGDMFGSVNALFSCLALIGVVVAIVFQKEDLKQTKKELARSAEAQEESAKALSEQISNQVKASRINGLSALLNSCDAELDSAYAHNRLIEELKRRPGFDARNLGLEPMHTRHFETSRNAMRQELEKLLAEAGQEFTEKGYYTEIIDER